LISLIDVTLVFTCFDTQGVPTDKKPATCNPKVDAMVYFNGIATAEADSGGCLWMKSLSSQGGALHLEVTTSTPAKPNDPWIDKQCAAANGDTVKENAFSSDLSLTGSASANYGKDPKEQEGQAGYNLAAEGKIALGWKFSVVTNYTTVKERIVASVTKQWAIENSFDQFTLMYRASGDAKCDQSKAGYGTATALVDGYGVGVAAYSDGCHLPNVVYAPDKSPSAAWWIYGSMPDDHNQASQTVHAFFDSRADKLKGVPLPA